MYTNDTHTTCVRFRNEKTVGIWMYRVHFWVEWNHDVPASRHTETHVLVISIYELTFRNLASVPRSTVNSKRAWDFSFDWGQYSNLAIRDTLRRPPEHRSPTASLCFIFILKAPETIFTHWVRPADGAKKLGTGMYVRSFNDTNEHTNSHIQDSHIQDSIGMHCTIVCLIFI